MSGMVLFDPQQIIARLVAEGVDFVVIGGVAATLQGAELPTLDLDIVYERSRENLERLAASLRFINVRLRGAEDVPLRRRSIAPQRRRLDILLQHRVDPRHDVGRSL